MARASEGARPLCLAVADLDHFKNVNDPFGHGVGDSVLRTVAQIFRLKTRPGDLLARMGGEEFLFALVDAPMHEGQDVCERLRAAVEAHPWEEVAAGLRVTISLGLCRTGDTETPARAIARADAALYEAKRLRRNCLRTG